MGLSISHRRLYYCHATVTDTSTLCPDSGCVSHTLWLHQILEDMRCPVRLFRRRVKRITGGCTACSVKGAEVPLLFLKKKEGSVFREYAQNIQILKQSKENVSKS